MLPMVSGTPSSYTLKVPRAVKLFPPLNQRVAARIRLIRQVQRKALIAVHNACLAVLVLPRDVGSIGQVDMPVQHQSRVIGIQNFIEHRKPAVRQVAEIPIAVQRRMGNKDIHPARVLDPAAQVADAAFHFRFGKLPGTGAVTAAAAKAHNAVALVPVQVIVNADRTAGRFSIIAGIMVAVYIKHRNRRCIGQKVHIMPAQVPAADDQVDIAQLAVGDTIVVDGKDMVVTSREDENGFVTINGGLEQGGVDLTSDDSGVYYAVGLDDTKSYHELGKVTVPVAEGFVLTDNADLEHPDETYAAANLAELAASEPGFTANNTLATIEHGELTVLARSYTP